MSAALTVTGLRKSYGEVTAVADISFAVAPGEIVGLLGPNGAGKTTTMESIAGLIDPDAGTIAIAGIDARADRRAAQARLGVVLQSSGLQPTITPREAITLFARLKGVTASPDLLARFGLEEKADARVATLSGGQRQRLALAIAFVGDPQVVLLDEPTTGLDPHARREFHDHVRAISAGGSAVLLTTHDMAEAGQLCDRVLVIDRGRIAALGSPRDLIHDSRATRVRVRTSGAPKRGWPAEIPGIGALTGHDGGADFATDDLNRALVALIGFLDASGLRLLSVEAGQATLEDLVLDLTRRASGG